MSGLIVGPGDATPEGMATVEENDSWRADIHTAVADEARRTGQPPVLIASLHLMQIEADPHYGYQPRRLWGEYVAWLTDTLRDARAVRRWERATRQTSASARSPL